MFRKSLAIMLCLFVPAIARGQNFRELESSYLLKYNTDTINLIAGMLRYYDLEGLTIGSNWIPRSFFMPGNCTPDKIKRVLLRYSDSSETEVIRNGDGRLKSIRYSYRRFIPSTVEYQFAYSGNVVTVNRTLCTEKTSSEWQRVYYYGSNNLPDSIKSPDGLSVEKIIFQDGWPVALCIGSSSESCKFRYTYSHSDAAGFRTTLPPHEQQNLVTLLSGDSLISTMSIDPERVGREFTKYLKYLFRSRGGLIVLAIAGPNGFGNETSYQWSCIRWDNKGIFEKAVSFTSDTRDTFRIDACRHFSKNSWVRDKPFSSGELNENRRYQLGSSDLASWRIADRSVSFYR